MHLVVRCAFTVVRSPTSLHLPNRITRLVKHPPTSDLRPPTSGRPGDPQSLNRYAYTRNNPLRYTDPSGHKFVEDNDANPCRVIGGCATVANGGWRNENHVDYQRLIQHGQEKFSQASPDLYIEGANAQASFATGGVEIVYDFTRNEVGYFRYSGVYLGEDMTGAHLTGYMGFGYKGDYINSSLAEAYSGPFSAASIGVDTPVDLLSAGVGSAVTRNADGTPNFNGVKTFTVQAGVGGNLVDIPFGNASATATNYTYMPKISPGSIGTDAQMIQFIWRQNYLQPKKALMLTILTLTKKENGQP